MSFALLIVIGGAILFKPVNFEIDTNVDAIRITTIADNNVTEITDDTVINRLVNVLNDTDFRKIIIEKKEAPDDLIAVIGVVCDEESIADIVVKGSTPDSLQFFINVNGAQLVAYDGESVTDVLSNYLF